MQDRIRQIMESQHMTQQTFAQFIELSPASLSSIFNGRTRPTLGTVEAIRKKLPTISLDWLMFGKGSMYVDDAPDATIAPDVSSTSRPQEQTLDFGLHSSSTPPVSQKDSQQRGGVYATPNKSAHNDVKFIDKLSRRITEIRVFYDDQTWESFVPKK